MTPGKFLRLIWPDEGFYCITHPFVPPGQTLPVHAQRVFATIGEAVTHVHEQMHVADTFFAILSLKQEKVWDPEKVDHKTGTKGAYAVRVHENMLASKCLFFDLDVGNDSAKYATQADALRGLVTFLETTKLPLPTLISSGGGVHVYWHFNESVPADQWRDIAHQLKQLAKALGLKVDPTRTTDVSSVLRVPDTFNWKDRSNPRPVKTLGEGVVTPVPVIRQLIADALVRAGVAPEAAPVKNIVTAASPLGVQTFNDFGPPPTLAELATACNQTAEIIRYHGDPSTPKLEQTAWYKGMLGLISHVEDGDNWCRKLTALKPRDNSQIEAKLLQLKQFPAPAKCDTLKEYMPWGDKPCLTCIHNGKVKNPLQATRKSTPAPPPSAAPISPAPSGAGTSATPGATPPPPPPPPGSAPQPLGLTVHAAMIPNPPYPYERLKSGGISLKRKDKDGNESVSVIYAHDLYPLKRLVNSDVGHEQQVWRTQLPRVGPKDFTIDADVLYDGRKFASAMAHNGIYPNKADIPALQDYMVAYIAQLQKDLDADNQADSLGWADDYQQFILPDKILLPSGGVKNSALTDGAKKATHFVSKRGDMVSQIGLLGFYNDPRYIPNQFAIMASLGSILLYMTGHHGVIVNMSGDSGASKSTTLYTALSLWGHPKLLPINGTNRGATANARSGRFTRNGSIPTGVDEITHMPPKDAIDLAMSVSQPGHRLRLGTDGNERTTGSEGGKSAICLTSANSSLHGLLSTDNAAGTAGSMRVFEMKFTPQRVHGKAEADDFLRDLEQHYGHIGEVFAAFVIQNRAAVEKRVQAVMRSIDIEGGIQSSERYWSAVIAVVLVAGEIAHALRLLPYDVDAIRQWALKVQVPFMRGVVKEEYRDPLAVMTDYIAEKSGNIIVIEKATSIGANTSGQAVAATTDYAQVRPHGALLGHYDMKAGVLYLMKQAFKDHCQRVGASSTRILDELNQARLLPDQTPRKIVVDRACRRTLGAGTDLAKGQTWCFAVDMTHPEIAGVAPTLAAAGGQSTSAPAGNLKAVK